MYKLQYWLPLVGSFRCPCRYILFFQLACAGLAAIAVGRLLGSVERRPLWGVGRDEVLPACLAAASLCTAIAGILIPGPETTRSVAGLVGGFVLVALAAVLVTLASRGAWWVVPWLSVLAAADLGWYGLSVVLQGTETCAAYAGVNVPPDPVVGRVVASKIPLDQSVSFIDNRMLLRGWHRVNGYAAMAPRRQLDYRTLPALRLAGVHLALTYPWVEKLVGRQGNGLRWVTLPGPLPHVRLVTRAIVSSDPAADIARIPLETAALVEQRVEISDGPPGVAEVLREAAGTLTIHVRCPSHQLLVVSEGFDPGWHAHVDAQEVPLLRVNGDFMGCVVGPGEHCISLAFQPASLAWGARLTVVGVLALTCLLIAGLVTPRDTPARPRLLPPETN